MRFLKNSLLASKGFDLTKRGVTIYHLHQSEKQNFCCNSKIFNAYNYNT